MLHPAPTEGRRELYTNQALPLSHLPSWPRLLSLDDLCLYLGVCARTCRKICPVPPLDLGVNLLRWDRLRIDEWVDSCPLRHRPDRNSGDAPANSNDSAIERTANAVENVRARMKRQK